MEPLIKNENFNFTFYKKMLDKIKQCKDVLCLINEEANQVFIPLYCILLLSDNEVMLFQVSHHIV